MDSNPTARGFRPLRGKVYDKTGREIMLGDVLKVYHFTGARRKRYFMYKQVASERFWPSGFNCWFLSHLTMQDDEGYYLARDGEVLSDYEIVQSIKADHEDRPRLRRDSDGSATAARPGTGLDPKDDSAAIAQTPPPSGDPS